MFGIMMEFYKMGRIEKIDWMRDWNGNALHFLNFNDANKYISNLNNSSFYNLYVKKFEN